MIERAWVLVGLALFGAAAGCEARVEDPSVLEPAPKDENCVVDEDCPEFVCSTRACVDGACVFDPYPAGRAPERWQRPGDCYAVICTGMNTAKAEPDLEDTPEGGTCSAP